MDTDLRAELVLRCVECIPEGNVVSYGDIARIAGTGPRVVGRIMAVYGSNVPWWRVTNAKGELPAALLARARPHWEAEGVAMNRPRTGVLIARHRADLATLQAQFKERTSDL